MKMSYGILSTVRRSRKNSMVHISLLPLECTGVRKMAGARYVGKSAYSPALWFLSRGIGGLSTTSASILGGYVTGILTKAGVERTCWWTWLQCYPLWREFRNIYDEVTQQSSLPLYLVVREALKNLKQEIANGASYGRKDADGNWIVTRTDEENLDRLEELTNMFSLTRFLANKTEQVKVDFKRRFGLLAEQYREVVDKNLNQIWLRKPIMTAWSWNCKNGHRDGKTFRSIRLHRTWSKKSWLHSDIENNRSATPLDGVTAQPCMDFCLGAEQGPHCI